MGSLEVLPTVSSLSSRADEIVRRVLAENEGRFESLSAADRARVEAMARAVASRILHEPTLRLKRATEEEDAYKHVAALRELSIAFGVLLDTFLVRSVLVPALVLDIGQRVWWPSKLARTDGEHRPEADLERRPAAV